MDRNIIYGIMLIIGGSYGLFAAFLWIKDKLRERTMMTTAERLVSFDRFYLDLQVYCNHFTRDEAARLYDVWKKNAYFEEKVTSN